MKEKVKAPTAYGLASKVLRTCISGISDAESTASTTATTSLEVEVVLPKAVLRAKNAYVKARREKKTGKLCSPVRFGIRELPVHCIVGIHPHERETKQPVCFDLDFVYAREPEEGYKFKFSELEKRVASVSLLLVSSHLPFFFCLIPDETNDWIRYLVRRSFRLFDS